MRVIELACQAAQIGNPNAVTDAGTGAALAQAALTGASYNMRINIMDLDGDDADVLVNQLEQLESKAAHSAEKLQGILRERGGLPL